MEIKNKKAYFNGDYVVNDALTFIAAYNKAKKY